MLTGIDQLEKLISQGKTKEAAELLSTLPKEEYANILVDIAKSEKFAQLPAPQKGQVKYSDIYYTIEAIRKQHLLSHRADIRSNSVVNQVDFQLFGSSEKVMVPEMVASFQRFMKSATLKKVLQEGGLKDFNPELILKNVQNDLENIILDHDPSKITKKLNSHQPLLFPLLMRTGEFSHATAVAIFNNLCLMADRGREEENGVEISQITDANKQQQLIKDAVSELTLALDEKNYDKMIYVDKLQERFVDRLNLKKQSLISFSPQYGENCAWSSSAKMFVFCALYARIYEAALIQPNNSKLPLDKRELVAHHLAQTEAKKIYKAWSHEDKLQYYKSYIDYYRNPDFKKYGPDLVLLAMIYVQSKHREADKDIVALLESSRLITETDIQKARVKIKQMAYDTLVEEYPDIQKQFPKQFDVFVEKVTDLFLVSSKKKVDEVFKRLEEVFEGGDFKQVLVIVDEELKKLKSAKKPVASNVAEPIVKKQKVNPVTFAQKPTQPPSKQTPTEPRKLPSVPTTKPMTPIGQKSANPSKLPVPPLIKIKTPPSKP